MRFLLAAILGLLAVGCADQCYPIGPNVTVNVRDAATGTAVANASFVADGGGLLKGCSGFLDGGIACAQYRIAVVGLLQVVVSADRYLSKTVEMDGGRSSGSGNCGPTHTKNFETTVELTPKCSNGVCVP